MLALEAVLAGGRVVRAGSRAPKTSAGYDLLGLLIGSEGTLGVITELTVRLQGIPEHAVVLRLAFPDVESACRAATTIVAAGAGVTRVELLDAWTIRAINAHQGTALPVGPSLYVEATGSEGTVASDLELVREIAVAEGATDVVSERDPTARTRLWAARHSSRPYASAAATPGKKPRSTDICVPLPPSSPLPSRSHGRRSSVGAWSRASSVTPGTATSTSRSTSTPTTRTRSARPTS